MKKIQAERVVKAIVDGVDSYLKIAHLADVEPALLSEHSEVLDRAIQLMSGFYKYGVEDMKPAGLPPPSNPYLNKEISIEEQCPAYFAFEAVQRNGITQERSCWTCEQLGLSESEALEAIETVTMPWRPENGWKSYAQLRADGAYVLMNRPPVKIKRHIERVLEQLIS